MKRFIILDPNSFRLYPKEVTFLDTKFDKIYSISCVSTNFDPFDSKYGDWSINDDYISSYNNNNIDEVIILSDVVTETREYTNIKDLDPKYVALLMQELIDKKDL